MINRKKVVVTNIKKAAAVFVSAAIMICTYSGCSFTAENAGNPSDYYTDLKTDGELIYNNKGMFSLNLSSESAEFSEELTEKNVTVCYANIKNNILPDIDAADGILLTDEEYSVVKITPDSVVRNSDKSVSVTFKDKMLSSNKPDSYIIMFDKDSNNENKYMFAAASVKYPVVSIVSDTTQIFSDIDSVKLNLTLDKSSFTDTITKENIHLSGGFSGGEITNTQRIGDNMLSVEISCPKKTAEVFGYITVDKSVISDAAYDAAAQIRFITPTVIFDTDSFEASDNYSRIAVSLKDCTFTDNASADMFKCNNPDIEISRFDRETQNSGVLYLSFDTESADKAVGLISASDFTVQESALNINHPVKFSVLPENPKISGNIKDVSLNGSDFNVTAEFRVLNGSFNVLSKNSFVFGGDYSKAEINTLTAKENTAEVVFSIPKTSSLDTAELYGTVALKSGSVISRWGALKEVAAFPIRYSASENSLEAEYERFDLQNMENTVKLFSRYAVSALLDDFSSLDGLMNESDDNGKNFAAYYSDIAGNNKYFSAVSSDLLNMINNEKGTVTPELRQCRLKLNSYFTDLSALQNAINSAAESVRQLNAVEQEIKSCNDAQELEKLKTEAAKLKENILSVYRTKINGVSLSTMLISVIDGFSEENGGAECFDKIADSLYNWAPQTYGRKIGFRCYVLSVISEASVISLYSIGSDEGREAGDREFNSIIKRINELDSYLSESSEKAENDKGTVYCNTLGRNLTLRNIAAGSIASADITTAEISQLENMLAEGTSLKDELIAVGFDISSVRYIICSDSIINTSFSSSYDNSGTVKKTYSTVSRTSVYDLYTSSAVSDYEFINHTFGLEMNGELQPDFFAEVNKNIGLFTLG